MNGPSQEIPGTDGGIARSSLARNVFLAMGLSFVLGCQQELDTIYGKRSGPLGGKSVNGTAVLADMFENAGHRVVSRLALSPSLESADVIVWAPDNFDPPAEEATQWLETWLVQQSGRTVVFIGRDYDAAPHYWRQVRPAADPEQRAEIGRRLRDARMELQGQRAGQPAQVECPWFIVDSKKPARSIGALSGPWSASVDATKVEIELNSRVVEKDGWDYEVLLASQQDLLVGARSIAAWPGGNSRLIVVANGSFLLNVPLVNHEHRKLAGRLIAEVGAVPKKVVFLESGPGAVPIREDEPLSGPPSVMAMISVWPLGAIVAHLVVLGLIFVYARWPIFGVAHRLPRSSLSDFGRHVIALGGLLRLTRDAAYARETIASYRQAQDGDTSQRSEAGQGSSSSATASEG